MFRTYVGKASMPKIYLSFHVLQHYHAKSYDSKRETTLKVNHKEHPIANNLINVHRRTKCRLAFETWLQKIAFASRHTIMRHKTSDDLGYKPHRTTDNRMRTLIKLHEWPSGLHSFRPVTEVKLGRGRSTCGWVTSRA